MDEQEKALLKRLQVIFKAEAEEHLQIISSSLISLEGTTDPKEQSTLVETVFREVHSFKGSARSVNENKIESVCQKLEDLFATLKRKERSLTSDLFDTLHKEVKTLKDLLQPPTEAPSESSPEEQRPSYEPSSNTVRISVDKLHALSLQTDEMRSIKLNATQRLTELIELSESISLFRQSVDSQTTHGILFKQFYDKTRSIISAWKYDQRDFQVKLNDLSSNLLSLLSTPCASFLQSLPSMVREVSRTQGKEINFTVKGGETEMDRRILEEVKDPILHIVRNAIDHGLESPDVRVGSNKPASGTISIQISDQTDNKVAIEISDDGAGINLEKLEEVVKKEKALEVKDEAKLLTFIFKSGISTASKVTELSGRGIGLAIAYEKVTKLGGSLTVESTPKLGTTFKMILPKASVNLRGILIELNGRIFAIPTLFVEKILRVSFDQISLVENRESVQIGNETLALVSLANILQIPITKSPEKERYTIIAILALGSQRICFKIGAILGDQELSFKTLGSQIKKLPYVSGITILGTGKLVPILDVQGIMKAAINTGYESTLPPPEINTIKKPLLIVEDSVTTRTLVKSILESHGYCVKTAVDGVEALSLLKTESFSLVISDVDMPRMNGFDLTERIRSEKSISNIPIILISSNEGREVREHGIDVGANAFVMKSHFNQTELLEVIKRLVHD